MAKRKGGDSTASTPTKKSSNKKDGTAKAKRTASTSTKRSNNEKDGTTTIKTYNMLTPLWMGCVYEAASQTFTRSHSGNIQTSWNKF